MSTPKQNILQTIANKALSDMGPNPTGNEIAVAVSKAVNTPIEMTAANGVSKQIAIIQMLDNLRPLTDKYSFLDKGSLEFGIGEMFIATGYKNSQPSATDTNTWVPEGAIDGLLKYTLTSTGNLERKVRNDYSEFDMREIVRNSNTFSSLISRESEIGQATKDKEHRELSRSLFGITVDTTILPTDYVNELAKIKALLNQNVKAVDTTTDRKSIVNYLYEFMEVYYNNLSTEFNMANKPDNASGNQWIDGKDTGTTLLLNSAHKEDTVLIMSSKFKNRLIQELGNTYNPEYWNAFTSLFGTVIVDTFDSETTMYILDKNAVGKKSMFHEYTNTYYPDKSAYHTLTKWRDHWFAITGLNAFKMTFTLTPEPVKVK